MNHIWTTHILYHTYGAAAPAAPAPVWNWTLDGANGAVSGLGVPAINASSPCNAGFNLLKYIDWLINILMIRVPAVGSIHGTIGVVGTPGTGVSTVPST